MEICVPSVTGPLGTRVVCQYGIITETKTAVIEMASAAGNYFGNSRDQEKSLTDNNLRCW